MCFFNKKSPPIDKNTTPPKKTPWKCFFFPKAEEELSETENLPDSDFEAASGGGATHRTSPGCWVGFGGGLNSPSKFGGGVFFVKGKGHQTLHKNGVVSNFQVFFRKCRKNC